METLVMGLSHQTLGEESENPHYIYSEEDLPEVEV